MPQRLVERMKMIDRKLDKLEVLIQKKKYVNADAEGLSRLSINDTSPPSLNELPLVEHEVYVNVFTCLTPIWTELWTIMNTFNVKATAQPLEYSTESGMKEGTRWEMGTYITKLNIKLSCILFEADLILVSNNERIYDDDDHPWTTTVDYILKNCTIKNMEQPNPAIPDFERSKPIVSAQNIWYLNHNIDEQSRIANFVVYDIVHLMADMLVANRVATLKSPFKESVQGFIRKDDIIDNIMNALKEILDDELKQKLMFILREMKPDLTEEESANPETLRNYFLHLEE
jgi:hypothetical protein